MTDYPDNNLFEDQTLQMLYYERINISEGNDPTKSNRNKECMICHNQFFNHRFKFQDFIFNGCHDLTQLSLHTRDIAIITVKNGDYCCIIYNISKSETNNLLENSVLEDRRYMKMYLQKLILKIEST